jgi:MarR family transcriptional regulator, temperature-dependent positive regulator of motility
VTPAPSKRCNDKAPRVLPEGSAIVETLRLTNIADRPETGEGMPRDESGSYLIRAMRWELIARQASGNHCRTLLRSPIHLLHRAYQSAGDVFQAEVRIAGLTPRQLAVLLAVAEDEGLNQTRVVDRTGIDRSTVADMVRRLQRKGLLQRRRTREDARAYALKLTNEGRRVLRAAEPLAKLVDARVLNALPSARRDQFIDALRALVTALDGMTPKSEQKSSPAR